MMKTHKYVCLLLLVSFVAINATETEDYSKMSAIELGKLLVTAVKGNNQDVVKKLIQSGADVHQEITVAVSNYDDYDSHYTCEPLGYAAECGYADVVRELIKAVAHVNLTNKNGDTALMCAIKNHDFDAVQSLLQSPEFHTGIWQLIKDSFSDSGTKSINYADKDGNTALIIAVKSIQSSYINGNTRQYNDCKNSQAIVETLFKTPGINPHHANKRGDTAINLLKKKAGLSGLY